MYSDIPRFTEHPLMYSAQIIPWGVYSKMYMTGGLGPDIFRDTKKTKQIPSKIGLKK